MPKARYYAKDLRDWTRFYGLRIGQPPVFPVNSVKAMRGALYALDRGVLPRYARAVFEAYWGDLQDISQDDVLAPIADARRPRPRATSSPPSPSPSTRTACAPTPTS